MTDAGVRRALTATRLMMNDALLSLLPDALEPPSPSVMQPRVFEALHRTRHMSDRHRPRNVLSTHFSSSHPILPVNKHALTRFEFSSVSWNPVQRLSNRRRYARTVGHSGAVNGPQVAARRSCPILRVQHVYQARGPDEIIVAPERLHPAPHLDASIRPSAARIRRPHPSSHPSPSSTHRASPRRPTYPSPSSTAESYFVGTPR